MLFDAEMNKNIADFGLSNKFIGHRLKKFCGSSLYTAPELLQDQNDDDPTVDV